MISLPDLSSLGLRVQGGRLFILDQTLLPHQEVWLESKTPQDMIGYIQRLAVRGAPLIGVAASLELARFALTGVDEQEWNKAAHALRAARPTAVNLMIAVDLLLKQEFHPEKIAKAALKFFEQDVNLCEKMASHGEKLISNGDGILTHCNTGGLATVGIGTALGVIRRAFENGKKIHVFVDETRPLLQGGRLTTWELSKLGIPFTLVTDNMAALLMKQKKIQKIFTGADRIAKNGDSANKIGTYGVAVLAHYHQIPFYIVAPQTTFDSKISSGNEIPIEERTSSEVIGIYSLSTATVYNPAFDVTPIELITDIVSDQGMFKNK